MLFAFSFQVSFVNFYTIFLYYTSLFLVSMYIKCTQDNMFSNFIPPSDFIFLSYAVLRTFLPASYIEHNEIIKNAWNSNFSSKIFLLRCLNYLFRFKRERKLYKAFLFLLLFFEWMIKSWSGIEANQTEYVESA